VFFKKSDRREGLVMLAGFPIDFDEAFVLCQLLKGRSSHLGNVEDITEILIRDEIFP